MKPEMTARRAALAAFDLITSAELDPSTRDLLTLEGLASQSVKWIDDEERASHVDVILSEYEAIAVERDDWDTVQAILRLREPVGELYRGSPWWERR